jgi:hypothetical protein
VHQLFIDFKKAYDEGVLYNILIEFSIPVKLVRLIKPCLNETYSVGKRFSGMLSVRDGLNKRRCLSPLLNNLLKSKPFGGFK